MSNNNIQKVSIRFFNDREVRVVWDETLSKWWFSVLDVVGAVSYTHLTLPTNREV